MSADQLLARIRRMGGRVLRMREWAVFVIMENEELADWLISLGGVPYLPKNMTPTDGTVRGAYRDSRGGRPKWDIYIHTIPVKGETTVWEAAVKKDADLFEVQ